jgi:hypothetical protein
LELQDVQGNVQYYYQIDYDQTGPAALGTGLDLSRGEGPYPAQKQDDFRLSPHLTMQ